MVMPIQAQPVQPCRPRNEISQNLMSDRWLSVEEIAAHLGVSKDTIYAWIAKKHMPAHRVGRLWKFQKSEIDDWVKAGGAGEMSEDGEGR